MTAFDITDDTWSLTWSVPALLHFIPLLMGITFSLDFKTDVKTDCYDKHNRIWEIKYQGPNEPKKLSYKGRKLSAR